MLKLSQGFKLYLPEKAPSVRGLHAAGAANKIFQFSSSFYWVKDDGSKEPLKIYDIISVQFKN